MPFPKETLNVLISPFTDSSLGSYISRTLGIPTDAVQVKPEHSQKLGQPHIQKPAGKTSGNRT